MNSRRLLNGEVNDINNNNNNNIININRNNGFLPNAVILGVTMEVYRPISDDCSNTKNKRIRLKARHERTIILLIYHLVRHPRHSILFLLAGR
jgi:hypothetical protein